jgi:endogenous inhibitor of DNA gyrase (YacG/DUF329 family)
MGPVKKTTGCAICGKPVADKFKPFCSQRCSMLDLGQWLGEGYKIAAEDDPDELPPGLGESDEIH